MNKYLIIGIITTALGAVLTGLAQDLEWKIAGYVISGLSLFIVIAGSFLNANKDKTEILENNQKGTNEIKEQIKLFRKELIEVKKENLTEESLKTVEKIENEFNEWAGSFVNNIESKVLERKKENLSVREREIILNKKWRPIYEYFFESFSQLITAYNEKAKNKIEFIIPNLPIDLFGKEANDFKCLIPFNVCNVWEIRLQIGRPHSESKIPSITIRFYQFEISEKNLKTNDYFLADIRKEFIILSFDIKLGMLKISKDKSSMNIGEIKNFCSIKSSEYKITIKDLLVTLFEYQLVSLAHSNDV